MIVMNIFGKVSVLSLLLFAGCATASQSNVMRIGETIYPPKPKGFEVEVFRNDAPEQSYSRVAKLLVHMEKTFFIRSGYEDAIHELLRQARSAGADAVIEIAEERDKLNETFIYNLSGIAIVYTNEESSPPNSVPVLGN